MLGLLSACGTGTQNNASSEAARYAARARGDYTPPGPPGDPWGPYIREASKRYDVPVVWIREVMRQESGGKLYHGGALVTSGAGAMGLMQVMPATYDELRQRYDLGPDPYDPHENIMAGTAYLREMYDIYGSPGFLAAYNAGPRRLDDYLSNNRTLPDETRKYVASIGPRLIDISPKRRSPAEQYAMNTLPTSIPAGTRYGRNGTPPSEGPVTFAYADIANRNTDRGGVPAPAPGSVQIAQLADPAPAPASPPATEPVREPVHEPAFARVAMVVPPEPPSPPPERVLYVPPTQPRSRFHLIASAQAAEPVPMRHVGPLGGPLGGPLRGASLGGASSGHWAIQVGAFGNESMAHSALGAAKDQAREPLSGAHPSVSSVRQPKGTLYRARMVGLSRESAIQACQKLSHGRSNCIVLSPDAQS